VRWRGWRRRWRWELAELQQGVTYQGEPSLSLTIQATSSRTITEQLNVGVVVDGAVFTGGVDVQALSDLQYSARLTVRDDLAVGLKQGNVEVRLCRDSPLVCAQPYEGSPWQVPYQIDVRSSDGLTSDVVNGDFASGTAGWGAWANQGSLSISSSSGVLKATTTSRGPVGVSTSMGLSYDGGIALEAGKRYRLSFDARADASRTIVPMVTENGRDLNADGFPYDDYITETSPVTSLTTTMTSYHLDFTMPVTNRSAGVVFYLGTDSAGSSAAVYLDNVSVTEVPEV